MTTGGDPDGTTAEDRLLAELRSAVGRADPVPDGVLEAARAAFTLRDLDAELARLVEDTHDTGLVGVRGGGTVRLLSWAGSDLAVELEVRVDGARRHLVGQVVGPAPASVVLETRGSGQQVDVDELGRFAARVAAGPLRLRLPRPGRTVVTSWVLA